MSATPPPKEKAAPGTNRAAANGNQEHRQTTTDASQGKRSFDPEVLEGLRSSLAEYLTACGVELKKQGARLVGKCPVHADSDPSLALFGHAHQTCGCHPCGHTGDVFATSQWMGRSTSFTEAVKEVAAVLGVHLQDRTAGPATAPVTPPQRAAKQPEVPFALSDSDRDKIESARFDWSDAFHGGDPIVDQIRESLGLTRETLRYAGHGSSGLGLAKGFYGKPCWLCYIYPTGLKYRNPAKVKERRFEWLCGKALAPWRWEWALLPDVRMIYLTEGETDCLALIEAGFESDGTGACVASTGTSFSAEWAPLFQGKRVVICFDSDTAGQEAALKVAELLAPHASEVLTWKGPIQ